MVNGNVEREANRPTSDIDQKLAAQEADLAELASDPDWQDSVPTHPAISPEDVGRFLQSRSQYSSGPKNMDQMALIARDYGHVAEVSNHLVRSPECPAESVVSLLEARAGDLDFVWYGLVKHSHQLGPETVAWAYDNHGSDDWVFAASLASHYQLADSLRERAYNDHGQQLCFARILVRMQANLSPEIIARVAQDHGNHPELATELAGRQPGLEENIIRSLWADHRYHSGFLNALAHRQPGFPEDLIRQALVDHLYASSADTGSLHRLRLEDNDLRLSPEPPVLLEPMTNIFIDQHDPDKGVLKFPQEISSGIRSENDEFTHFVHAIFENTAVLSDELLTVLWNHPAVSQPHARHYIAGRPAAMPPELVDQIYRQSQDNESALTSLFNNQPNQPAERLRESYNRHATGAFISSFTKEFWQALCNQTNLPEDIRQEIRSKLGLEARLGWAVLARAD